VAAGLALACCWSYGVFFQINQTPETLAAMSDGHRNLYETRPAWAFLAFAA
jgi:hypothetical protein